jgi:hypothetical protein
LSEPPTRREFWTGLDRPTAGLADFGLTNKRIRYIERSLYRTFQPSNRMSEPAGWRLAIAAGHLFHHNEGGAAMI